MKLYEGCVENRNDPLKLGRCQVRIVGLHTHDKNILPTKDLPWAYPLQPLTSAAISGIGHSPVGPVEGTWVIITFRDSDEQMPVMMGTIGGIPQSQPVTFDNDDDSPILKSESGSLEYVPTAEDQTPQVAENVPTVKETVQNSSVCPDLSVIPVEPPPDIKSNRSQAKTNIKLIIEACCKEGFTKEQTCSLLALIGGESEFIPKSELYEYKDANYLMSIFPSAFNGDLELAKQYSAWKSKNKGTREEWFEFIYGVDKKKGRELGNTAVGDGGKYYGRGLLQITGKYNYNLYSQQIGKDLLNNPELLNSDINVSIQVAIKFFLDKVKAPSTSAHPGYFNAAKNAVNRYDNPEKKVSYYEYFYGQSTPESIPDKTTEAKPPETAAAIQNNGNVTPSPSLAPSLGFKDPNDKYPLKDLIFEQDTNRLARGVSQGTIVEKKQSQRALNIPKAFGKGSYNEPYPPFAARYPFNHVFESESGHVQEFDDTPGFERVHFYHRKGTFTEVDANGSEVHHIVGDGYHIIDRNGSLYIRGECNITVDGNTNIFARSDANVEVSGDANMKVGGDFNIGVAENMNIAVGGNLSMYAKGTMNFNSIGQMNQVSSADIRLKSSGELHMQGSKFHADADRVDFNNGTSSSANVVTLTPPSLGAPLYSTFPYLVAPDQIDEALSRYETPEDWNTPEAIAVLPLLKEKHPDEPVETIEETQPTAAVTTIIPEDCSVILATQEFTADFRLSENFTLGMMFDEGFNRKHKLVDQNGLTKQQIVCNLSQLCKNVLEKYLTILPGGIAGYGKQWTISSGYRQGTSSSDHNKGQAVDITLSRSTKNRKEATYELAKQFEKLVPYDQMILEYRGTSQNWIHTSYRGSKNRKMAFTMLNDKTYPKPGSPGFKLL